MRENTRLIKSLKSSRFTFHWKVQVNLGKHNIKLIDFEIVAQSYIIQKSKSTFFMRIELSVIQYDTKVGVWYRDHN